MKTTARCDVTAYLNLPSRFSGGVIAAPGALPDRVRIHLTHPCPILRIGMATILATQPGIEVIDKAAPVNGPDADADADAACIVITDYATGMHLLGQRGGARRGGIPKVLIVTSREKEWDVRQAVETGVHGYLLQNCIPDELVRSVRLLGRGLGYLSPTLKLGVADALRWEALTRRENDVLRLLACGDSNKTIENELGIGVVTVKTHVGQLMQKLNATTRTHAVAIALSRGLLPSGADTAAASMPVER